MHGDFSRGHRPDRKRGQEYTRAFAQERRLMLDSDLNAATDALHERLRGLANHLGCPKGGPDFGYLVTPGRLLALFRDLEGIVVSSAGLTIDRDYQHKYLDRYPSLRLAADHGAQGAITLRLREAFDGPVVVWCRRDAGAVATFNGAALAVPLNPELQPVTANVLNAQDVEITLESGGEIWIGLIEGRQAATPAPRFDYACGHYYLDGLPLHNAADTTWVTNAPAGGNVQVNGAELTPGNRLLVYVEGWERHVTYIEDLGLLERALGGDTDTMTRGRATGQVKVAFVPANFNLEAFGRALASPILTDGTLEVTTPPAAPNPDPCALPVQGGYTGRDNRFYRFEVHAGGVLGVAKIKWSRDNGSELFAVTEAATDAELTFPSNTLLQGGDLVEILSADSVELGDGTPAVLDGAAGTFTPPVRLVGVLARLVGPTSNGGATFTLSTPDGGGPLTLPGVFGPFPTQTLKVRRWHGLIATTPAPVPNDVEVENGLRIALSGTFSPGDYWQYEARASGDNANGPFATSPHGPERDFAPLALMRYTDPNEPLVLERWLDDRFVPICDLTADDVAFDGDRIGSESDTVQEIIEELWEKTGGGCCEFTLEPSELNAAPPIAEILQATQGEVTICFEPGIYRFTSTLDIDDRTVILKGCPRAVFVGERVTPIFNVVGTGRLVLDNLVVYARQAGGTRVLIDVGANATGLDVRETALCAVPDAAVDAPSIAIRVIDEEPSVFDGALVNPPNPPDPDGPGPPVRLYRALVAAEWGLSAASLRRLDIVESVFECATGCVWAERSTQVDVRSNALVAGAALDTLAEWTPAALLSERDGLFAALGELSLPEDLTAHDGVGVWMGSADVVTIADCQLVGGVGFAVTHAAFLHFRNNRCFVARTGVHLVEARECSIDGSVLFSSRGRTGVIVDQARKLSLTGCSIAGFEAGVGLGTLADTRSRSLADVQVQGNRIDVVRTGVQVGPDLGELYTGRLAQVAITGNTVRARSTGVVVNALTIGSRDGEPLVVQSVTARVADNMITARNGIAVSGRDVEVADNAVRLASNQAPFFGIVGVTTSRLKCEANHIEVSVPQDNIDGFEKAATESHGFMAAIGVANVQSAAIVLAGGDGATVANNVMQADDGVSLRSLSADKHAGLSAKGNEFMCGPAICADTDEIVFHGNTIAGLAQFSSSTDGQVADNRVRGNAALELEGDLEILLAAGRWKIADNRADGAIRVVPASTGRGFLPGGFDFGGLTIQGWRVMDTIANLSGDRRFVEMVNRGMGPAAGEEGPVATRASQPLPREAGSVSYAMTNVAWHDDYRRAMKEFVIAGAINVVNERIDRRDIGVFIRGRREGAYHLQCTANWSRVLVVGNLSNDVRIDPGSVIQVISNRADEEISVRHYAHLVMALNVAAAYTAAGNALMRPIDRLNLKI